MIVVAVVLVVTEVIALVVVVLTIKKIIIISSFHMFNSNTLDNLKVSVSSNIIYLLSVIRLNTYKAVKFSITRSHMYTPIL